jgi:hypothetical protein
VLPLGFLQDLEEPEPGGSCSDEQGLRPTEFLNTALLELITSPAFSRPFDLPRGDGSAVRDIDSSGDDEQFPRMAQQRGPSHALKGTMLQKSLPGFRRRTFLVARQHARIAVE